MNTDTRTATETNAVTLDRATGADGRTFALHAVSRAFRRAVFATMVAPR